MSKPCCASGKAHSPDYNIEMSFEDLFGTMHGQCRHCKHQIACNVLEYPDEDTWDHFVKDENSDSPCVPKADTSHNPTCKSE